LARRLKGNVVTCAWILTEVGDALADPSHRESFIKLIESLRSDPQTVIVSPQEAHFNAGCLLYASRCDKDWSLTDCISFVIMKELGISTALTGDRHFQQAGFVALLA